LENKTIAGKILKGYMKTINSNLWQFKGSEVGSHIMILGGIHGNEKTGVAVINKLYKIFSEGQEKVIRGILTFGFGNEEAIATNVRGVNGRNLNRFFTKQHLSGSPENFYESQRAHILAPLLASADILLDLHATFYKSEPFLACANSSEHEKIFRWFEADTVLIDPNFVIGGERATTDEYVDECGGIGVCFEAGWMEDVTLVDSTLKSVLSILRDQKVLAKKNVSPAPQHNYRVFELFSKTNLTKDGFCYAEQIGMESFFPVGGGQIIGYVGEQKIIVPEDGVLIFQRTEDQWRLGEPIFFFAKKIK